MSFGHPFLLLTLLLVHVALAAHRLLDRRRARYAVRYTNVAVLEHVLGGTRPWRRWLTSALALLALATLCVAVARPHVHTTVVDDRATVILVLDVSGSMHAVDVKPTRLQAAQLALHNFLDAIPSRLRVGLVLFAGEAQVATPPTREHQLVADAIDDADFFNGFGGTAIGDAIDLAVRVGVQSAGISDSEKSTLGAAAQLASYVTAARPTKSSLVSILFLSDGKQNRGIVPPLVGAEHARAAAVPIYTVALGTTGNTHLENGYMFGGGFGLGGGRLAPDPRTLRAIARITGGEFFQARTAHALQDAYRTLGSRLGQRRAVREVTDLFALGGALLLTLGVGLAAWWAPRLP